MASQCGCSLTSKDLTVIEDQLTHLATACRVAQGYAGSFQDVMHMVVTVAVVLLSIVSLSIIIAAGIKSRNCRSYGVCAGIALGMMLVGAFGMKLVPAAYFGVVERFSVFAATGFNAALGIYLFCMNIKENN